MTTKVTVSGRKTIPGHDLSVMFLAPGGVTALEFEEGGAWDRALEREDPARLALQSFILALASEGFDIESEEFEAALTTTLDSIDNE